MKKLLWLLPLLVLSCDKAETPIAGKQNVTIGYRMVEENSMTRSLTHDEVLSAIDVCMPVSIDLLVKNSAGEKIVVKSGEETDLAVGTYNISGSALGGQVSETLNSNTYFTSTPYITVAGNIEVIKGINEYSVNGTYKSLAFVIDYDETASAEYQNNTGEWKTLQLTRVNNIGIVFFQGTTQAPLAIRLNPKDTEHKETTFYFSTTSSIQYVQIENGKYYKMHPQAIDAGKPKIDISYIGFQEGEL